MLAKLLKLIDIVLEANLKKKVLILIDIFIIKLVYLFSIE